MMRSIVLLITLAFIATTPPPAMLGLYSYPPSAIIERNAWLQERGAPPAVIGGEFIDIGTRDVKGRLQQYTNAGVIPFVNIMIGFMPERCPDLQAVNSGQCDTVISEFVSGFVAWGGRAYIAPFPEANGGWVSYGLQADQYKAAYIRVRNAFVARGATQSHALFVFAPNGWAAPGHEFENYYPGDSTVDAVGFSFFSGECSGGDKTIDDLYQYLRRMKSLAPGKPIYLTQFGVSNNKSEWLGEILPYLSEFGIAGVLYYDAADACDYSMDDITGLDLALQDYTASPEWDKIFVAPPRWCPRCTIKQ